MMQFQHIGGARTAGLDDSPSTQFILPIQPVYAHSIHSRYFELLLRDPLRFLRVCGNEAARSFRSFPIVLSTKLRYSFFFSSAINFRSSSRSSSRLCRSFPKAHLEPQTIRSELLLLQVCWAAPCDCHIQNMIDVRNRKGAIYRARVLSIGELYQSRFH